MKVNKNLTNEMLNKRFDNPFTLVTYAIKLAKLRLQRGEENESNPANEILSMIESNQDIIELEEDIQEEAVLDEELS